MPSGEPEPDRRGEILRYLRDRDTAVGIAEIAESLGVHPNTVRFHLQALVDHGQVQRSIAEHDRPGRPPQRFAAVRVMDPTGPRNYRLLAEVLVDHLAAGRQPARQAVAAGRRWGRQQAAVLGTPAGEAPSDAATAVGRLVDVLDQLDFAPEPTDDGAAPSGIGLRHCPFLDIAASSREVICPLHLGLMHGVLEAWGSTVDVERLEAFVEPDLCLAHLTYPDAS